MEAVTDETPQTGNTVFACHITGTARWTPNVLWESQSVPHVCESLRFEAADLVDAHLSQVARRESQVMSQSCMLCAGLDKLLSAQDRCAVILLFALVLDRMSTGHVPLSLLRRLGALNRRTHEWLRPRSNQMRAPGRAIVELWSWLIGVCRWVLLTKWQLRAGIRRRSIALRRLQFLPESVRPLFQHGWNACLGVPPMLFNFLRMQVAEPLKASCLDSVVYVVGGRRKELYVGYSSHLRTCKSARLGAPVPRVNEHFRETLGPPTNVKTKRLQLESLCDLGALVIFSGPDLQARALEKILIASMQPALNSAWHGPTMGKTIRTCSMRHSAGASARRRPPKYARSGANTVSPGPCWHETCRLMHNELQRRAGQVCRSMRELMCASVLARPFPVVYDLCLSAHLCETGTFGPLSAFGNVPHLLAAWVCYRPAVVEWAQLLKKPYGYKSLFKLHELLKLMPTSGRRRLGMRRLQFALQLAGEPPARKHCLKVPPELGFVAARAVLRECKQYVKHGCPHRWAWMRQHLHLCRSPSTTFAGEAQNQSHIAQQCQLQVLLGKPEEWASSAKDGRDMHRIKKYWKLPCLRDAVVVAQSFIHDVQAWFRQCNQRHVKGCTVTSLTQYACSLTQPPLIPTPEFEAYTVDMRPAGVGEALVLEDKDTATLWRQDADCYTFRVHTLLEDDHVHWQRTNLSPGAALQAMRATFDWASQHSTLPRYPSKRWLRAGIPYLYGTVKSKCYNSFCHVCTKPAHSCYRKIVSWFWHPAKRWLRHCNRGLLSVIRLVKPGFTATSLKTAVQELIDSSTVLAVPEDERKCIRCCATKLPWELCVMDIEAMFESIDPKHVNIATESLAAELNREGVVAVVIPTARQCRRKPFLTKTLHISLRGMRVVPLRDILVGTALTLAQRFVRFGNTVWRQCAGTPIGGICSTSSADVCLSYIEHEWLSNPSAQLRSGYAHKDLRFQELVACKRYVDDLCLASRHFCRKCLSQLPAAIYPDWITWEEAEGEAGSQAWLDVHLQVSSRGIRVTPRLKDERFLSGQASEPVQFTLPPFLGRRHMNFQLLLAHVCSRVARWRQLNLDPLALVQAVAGEAAVWLKYKYPPNVVSKLWAKQQHLPEVGVMMRAIMRQAGQQC